MDVVYAVAVLCYVLVMLNLLLRFETLLDPAGAATRRYNLEPLHTIRLFWHMYRDSASPLALRNLLGNVVLFVPMGMYLGVWGRGRWGHSFVLVWLLPVAVELLQYALRVGACDIDDVLLNGVGGCIGLLGYRALAAIGGQRRAKAAVTALSLLAGVVFVAAQAASRVSGWLR